MDEPSTRPQRTPDPAEPNADREPSSQPGPNADENPPQANHPDGPDHPTTPYDHIWYDRRPLH